jgi:hypothetical protein
MEIDKGNSKANCDFVILDVRFPMEAGESSVEELKFPV